MKYLKPLHLLQKYFRFFLRSDLNSEVTFLGVYAIFRRKHSDVDICLRLTTGSHAKMWTRSYIISLSKPDPVHAPDFSRALWRCGTHLSKYFFSSKISKRTKLCRFDLRCRMCTLSWPSRISFVDEHFCLPVSDDAACSVIREDDVVVMNWRPDRYPGLLRIRLSDRSIWHYMHCDTLLQHWKLEMVFYVDRKVE